MFNKSRLQAQLMQFAASLAVGAFVLCFVANLISNLVQSVG